MNINYHETVKGTAAAFLARTRGVCRTSYFVPRTSYLLSHFSSLVTRISYLLITCLSCHVSAAQFVPYSQYYNSPLLTNPAEAALSDVTQLTVHYRKSRVANYEIPSVSFVHPFYRDHDGMRWGGAGVTLINQKAGPSGLYDITAALGTFAYTVHFTKRHHVSAGLQGGVIRKKIDLSAITTDNQFNLGAFDPSLPLGENIQFSQASGAVINAGFNWTFTDSSNVPKAMISVAFSNMNRPAYEFIADNEREELVYTLTGEFKLLEYGNASLYPMFRYVGSAVPFANAGAQLRYQLAQDYHSVSLGAWYKTTNALIAAIQYNNLNYTIAASMDFSTNSGLQANINNAVELSFGWRLGRKPKHKPVPSTRESVSSSVTIVPAVPVKTPEQPHERSDEVMSYDEVESDKLKAIEATPQTFQEDEVFEEITPEETAIINARIEFAFGSSELTPESVRFIESHLAPVMKNHPTRVLHITGHSCTIGDKAINKEISLHRAAAVKQFLLLQGIPSARLVISGMDFQRPIASNDTENGRRKNRRVEFEFIGE